MTMKGFTLVEALVAIAIVSIAIAGPMYAANRAIVAAQIANSQFVAAYLAQEGIEYVRSMRDDAYLYQYSQGNPDASIDAWTDFSTSGPSDFSIWQCEKTNPTTNACTLDPFLPMGTGNNESLGPCKLPFGSGNDCAPLYLTPSNIYTQNSSPPNVQTPFTRTIQIEDISSTVSEVNVISTVSWNFHATPYSVSITDHLTSWQ
jgi:prepilin-type N-terminal cleavage/methylation domain-containing protein